MVHKNTILESYALGESQGKIAMDLGISARTVSRVIAANFSEAERKKLRGQRDLISAAVKGQRIQQERISSGKFRIIRSGEVLVAVAGEVRFIFDICDEYLLRRYPWRVTADKRLARQVRRDGHVKNIYVYHDILNVAPSMEQVVDHINRNPRDNRRANLRVCSHSENCLNRSPSGQRKALLNG
ncbi:HNH endonuclease [Novosphingobium pentaromativorans]|uniref:HNH endonuclease n=1 Tax=Novosphingobium pentaromativorans TaxID=205844 RepID=UPI0009DB409B|nr:HNH endonuclease [Novosphingobium pentaromativorans]